MFLKTMQPIKKLYKKWLQLYNQRKTLRQAVPFDTGDGAVQSVLAHHSVQKLRKKLQEESTEVRPPAVGAPMYQIMSDTRDGLFLLGMLLVSLGAKRTPELSNGLGSDVRRN